MNGNVSIFNAKIFTIQTMLKAFGPYVAKEPVGEENLNCIITTELHKWTNGLNQVHWHDPSLLDIIENSIVSSKKVETVKSWKFIICLQIG